MKNLLVVLSILVALMAGNLFAQDSLVVQSKKQYRYKNQVKTANGVQSQSVKGQGFVDEDGDGIPNGQDDDFVRPQDGSGAKRGGGNGDRDGSGNGKSQGKRGGGRK